MKYIFLLFLLGSFAGCGSGSSTTPADADGDGLSDNDELNLYGTSPLLADTDGDGFSDGDEILNYGFDANVDRYRYNPLLADLPLLDIEIATVPNIVQRFTESDSTEGSISNSNGGYTADTVSGSHTNTIGVAVEVGLETEISTTSASAKTSVKVTGSYSHAWTNGTSSEQQSNWESVESSTNGRTLSSEGGEVSVGVRLINSSHVPFTLEHVSLTLAQTYKDQQNKVIGTLNYDGGFSATSLGGKSTTTDLTFIKSNIDTNTMREIFLDSRSLTVTPALYQMTDINGDPIVYDQAVVDTRTAYVEIDYAFSLPTEKYWAATNVDDSNPGLTLEVILTNLLDIPVTEGSGSGMTTPHAGLLSVRNIQHANEKVRWVVTHVRDSVSDPIDMTYDIRNQDYALSSINIKAGDQVFISYLNDADGDGLGIRQESLYGTDPLIADTDGDGRTDFEEVKTPWNIVNANDELEEVYSNPLLADADNDTLNDSQEQQKSTNPDNNDTDGDGILDPDDSSIATGEAILDATLNIAQQQDNEFRITGIVQAGFDANLTNVAIDWGNGETPMTLNPSTLNPKNISIDRFYSYTSAGTYDFSITANELSIDGIARTLSKTSSVQVFPVTTVNDFLASQSWNYSKHIVDMADMNNDGKADVVGIGHDRVWVALADGNGGFNAATAWNIGYGSSNYADSVRPTPVTAKFVDLNNDSLPDVLIFDNAGVRVMINNNGLSLSNQLLVISDTGADQGFGADSIREVADINGDSKPDIVAIKNGTGTVAYINTSATGGSFTVGARKVQVQSLTDTGGWSRHDTRLLADVNGDGRDDLIGFGTNGVSVMASTGDGHFQSAVNFPEHFVRDPTVDNNTQEFYVVDIDQKNGKDLVRIGDGGIMVAFNTGNLDGSINFAAPVVKQSAFSNANWVRAWGQSIKNVWNNFGKNWVTYRYTDWQRRMIKDINADGYPDIIGFRDGRIDVSLNTKASLASGDAMFSAVRSYSSQFPVESGAFGYTEEPHPTDTNVAVRYIKAMPRFVEDINGDGQSDFVSLGINSGAAFSSAVVGPFVTVTTP
ncbi:MAG: FG-GAP-like repeat-containing protein [Gammaproteobacteria bacterium]|nr:FG-GAP-like repeat-containing protein [Gammaproteobacteria bacterium]